MSVHCSGGFIQNSWRTYSYYPDAFEMPSLDGPLSVSADVRRHAHSTPDAADCSHVRACKLETAIDWRGAGKFGEVKDASRTDNLSPLLGSDGVACITGVAQSFLDDQPRVTVWRISRANVPEAVDAAVGIRVTHWLRVLFG